MFDLTKFINSNVIKRTTSLFLTDIAKNREELTKGIQGKCVLIIGGAGSIGTSFIKSILPYRPAELVVVDTNENALTELTRFLRSDKELSLYMPSQYRTYPMDYSSVVFERMFMNHQRTRSEKKGFDIVANFSAHKHVRSEKDIYSIEALVRNNIINADGLLKLLEEYPPELFFCVSTDKAANPVNIMGASKRIMEDLIFSYSDAFPVKTARFANVAFSNGSLPAGFIERISKHQPVSAPNDVKRYFVSPEESGQICMLAAILGENRDIFFPKLEEAQMVSFDQIAKDYLIALGYELDYCKSEMEAIEKAACWNDRKPYPVYFSPSDTNGEKSFEEFYTSDEAIDMERFCSLGVVINKTIPDRNIINGLINEFERAFSSLNCTKERVIDIISEYLPGFKHIETGKNLDEKM